MWMNKRNRGRKGQIFIIIILVIIGIIVLSIVLSSRSARVRASPTVQEVFWRRSGERVTSVDVGDDVEAHVVVRASEEYVGSIVVKVRKDVRWWFDSDYSTKTIPVTLRGGQEIELELEFAPDEASSSGMRGYFIEVEFSATNTNWEMEGSYPPRLKVT